MASHKSVTTHRAPKKTVTTARTAVTLTAATVGSIALLPNMAQADPQLTFDQAKQQLDTLNTQAEQASEAYNAANTQLAALQHKVDEIQSKITLEQGTLSTAQASLGSLAAAQYKTGGIDNTLQLMLSTSPDAFLQQASAMSEVSGHQASSLKNAQDMQRQLQQDKATAADDLAKLQKTRDLMAAQKADIEAKTKAAKELLESLTPVQQQEYRKTGGGDGSGGHTTPPPGLPVPTDPRAAIAVKYAEAQVGKPYVWAASGPNAFDCSGLTMAAWGKAGVSMDHGSVSQGDSFPRVSLDKLQPGDLILFYRDLHHIGIYIGNGMVIHAGNPSSGVQYIPMNEMPVMFAVRP